MESVKYETVEELEAEFESLHKLIAVSEPIALIIALVPLLFIGGHIYVFLALILIALLLVGLVLFDEVIEIEPPIIKMVTVLCLAIAAGAVQLHIIPLLCVTILALLSMLNSTQLHKFIYAAVFVVVSFLTHFIVTHVFTKAEVVLNLYADTAAVFAVFFAFSVHGFTWVQRYQIIATNYEHMGDRHEHFVELANKLARYTPEPVWKQIVQSKKDVTVGNKRRKLSVFFSDIKGFTDLSEEMSAEDLTFFLNNYFESMSKVAKLHGGTIDKFIGDALMVFFGDPETKGEKEDAVACVEMAVDMTRELARLRNYWVALGFDGLNVRMGISTGYCHVGNFGSNNRVSYTAIGREVNMAARIQHAARPDTVLISERTYELVKHKFLCQEYEPIILKGFAEPVRVWEVRRHRQGDEIKDAKWLEHDLPGFNLHLNMNNIQQMDKAQIREALVKASRVVDASMKKDKMDYR